MKTELNSKDKLKINIKNDQIKKNLYKEECHHLVLKWKLSVPQQVQKR